MRSFAGISLVVIAACGGGASAPDAHSIDAHPVDANAHDARPGDATAADAAGDATATDATTTDATTTDATTADAPAGDASPADAAGVDAIPADAQLPGDLGFHIVDHVTIPTTSAEIDAYGFDLDVDGTIDNQLGVIQTAIVQAGGAELEQAAVDRGTILWLAAGVACPGTCLETYTGSNPAPSPCSGPGDTVCRHHLDGTGSFDATFDPAHARLSGTSSGTTYDATGTLRIPLVVFAGPPAWVHLRRAHGHLTAVGAEWSGKVGGAITEAEVQSEIFPAIHTGIADQIAADCTGSPPPGCGCTSNTLGASYLGMFDENFDCTVTLDEVRTHTMMTTLFRPDIDLDGDGTLDAISAGVHVTTVGASFALP